MSDSRLRSLVTGCSGALGQEIIRALSARGDIVVGIDRVVPEDASFTFFPVELSDRPSVVRAVENSVHEMGGIDVLIHAAGIMRRAPFEDITEEEMLRHLEVNLMGAFRVCQIVSERMLETGGRVLLITSIHAQVGVPHRAAYAASKGGVEAMGRVLAAELAPHRVRVNMLAPGAIDGGIQSSQSTRDYWIDATPIKRVASLEEVARAAVFLTSNDASFINGQTLTIDGGANVLKMLKESDQVA